MRKTILLVSLLSFAFVSSLVFNEYIVKGLTENAGESPWPTFRGNLRRTGHSTATPKIDKLLWRISGPIQCSPAVVDDKVFIGLENGVHALNAKTGQKIWNYTVEVGLYALSVADGMVFIGATDHKVYALNETTGDQIWNYTTGWRVNSSPAVAEGIVFIGSDDGNVYALNETTGTIIWNYTTGRGVSSSPAIDYGMLFIGSFDYNVYALNATTGVKIWSYKTDYYVESTPAVVDKMVFIASIGLKNAHMFALNETTGTMIWKYTVEEPARFLPLRWSSPAVAEGMVFIGSGDHNVYALNKTNGKEIWSYETGGGVDSSPAVANGMVFIGSHDHNLYVLDEMTGKEVWKYHTDAEVFFSPAVVNDRVYFPSNNCLYVFGPKSLIEILFPIIFFASVIGVVLLVVILRFIRAPKARASCLAPMISIFYLV